MRKGKRERDALRLLKAGHRAIVAANMAAPVERDLGLRNGSCMDARSIMGRTHVGARTPNNVKGSASTGPGPHRARFALS